ncbi:LacI family DNA-binding transcriptional regulator [Actinopolymorpha alba]|uniref:LacI family DNA-binding transcriptional regulator n=1 Tax=Actinopolymorpha alba TaxID=533267 RepID=UPI00036137C8|nr:LacI family DNA-binding transcriptional regulator [Actinopolymorpha alba]
MATIADVARRAGVAPSTVSYVLTNRRSISPATREAVEKAIRDLDYRPHAGARSLRGARTRVLALSEPRDAGRYQSIGWRFVHHLSSAARAHDYDLLLLTGEDNVVDNLRRVAGSRLADGAMVMSLHTDDPRVPALRELRFPAALIGKPRNAMGLPWCDFDFAGAAALAVRELARAGHRQIAFVGSSDGEFQLGLNYAPRAVAGARVEAKAAGVHLHVIRSSRSHRTMVRRTRALLASDPAPTAVIIHYDVPALPSILRGEGYSIPEDLSVVVIAATPDLSSELPLARSELPVEEMTRNAVELALAAIEGDPSDEHRLIPARLTKGQSIAPPRRRS